MKDKYNFEFWIIVLKVDDKERGLELYGEENFFWGYDLRNCHLFSNPKEARRVRYLFLLNNLTRYSEESVILRRITFEVTKEEDV